MSRGCARGFLSHRWPRKSRCRDPAPARGWLLICKAALLKSCPSERGNNVKVINSIDSESPRGRRHRRLLPLRQPSPAFVICVASVVSKASISPAAAPALSGTGACAAPAVRLHLGKCRWTQRLPEVSPLPDVQSLGHPNHCPVKQVAPAGSRHTWVRGSCCARRIAPCCASGSAPCPCPVSVRAPACPPC